VRQEERDADRRLISGGQPLVGEEADRPQLQALLVELSRKLADARLDLGPRDPDVEVADPEVQEVVVGELFPRDLPG